MRTIMQRIFLSSTGRDLVSERQAVFEAITALDGYHCVWMESFGARTGDARTLCREMVESCSVVVLIVGHTYGSKPKGLARSFTVLEYEAAAALGIPVLVFMASDDFPVPASLIEADEDRARQRSFRTRLKEERVIAFFESDDKPAGLVSQALFNLRASAHDEAPAASVQRPLRGPRAAHPRPRLAWLALAGTALALLGGALWWASPHVAMKWARCNHAQLAPYLQSVPPSGAQIVTLPRDDQPDAAGHRDGWPAWQLVHHAAVADAVHDPDQTYQFLQAENSGKTDLDLFVDVQSEGGEPITTQVRAVHPGQAVWIPVQITGRHVQIVRTPVRHVLALRAAALGFSREIELPNPDKVGYVYDPKTGAAVGLPAP
ncbi:MAG: hypothetical protein JWN04_5241 [Myxococcaceae bacterium]|nr:hypothetical protein [Myxococcaceae bacterium]